MAKEKRTAADLDAELAALEAELAALEGKAKRKPAKAAPAAPAAPAPAARVEEPAPAVEKKGRFSLPLKRGKKEAPAPAAPPVAPEAPPPRAAEALLPISAAEATPPAPPPSPADAFDMSVWRHEGDAWVRVVPETPVPVVRRVLDENGNVVREERADARAVEEATGVKAERGLGRLLRRK